MRLTKKQFEQLRVTLSQQAPLEGKGKRTEARVGLRAAVTLRTAALDDVPARIRDISLNGISVLIRVPLKPEEAFAVQLLADDGVGLVELPYTVKRCDETPGEGFQVGARLGGKLPAPRPRPAAAPTAGNPGAFHLDTMLATSAAPFAVIDRARRLLFANNAFAALLARPGADLAGRTLDSFTHPDDRTLYDAWGGDGGLPSQRDLRLQAESGKTLALSVIAWGCEAGGRCLILLNKTANQAATSTPSLDDSEAARIRAAMLNF